ncbi:hypothetical protein [Nonomuraea guangzhouensis]|uniref:RICIN domain-containing protein n=1 Tax=Nonomuraea guangzhouensis TaxID=1291555 RepID=A0ABW4G7H5_9ACTN|nr:hypothetical protein [Nonomuraea guangzhouensis]
MKRLRSASGRWTKGVLTLAMLAASGLICLNATPAGAAADPKPGEACTAADLGKRYPIVKSAVMTPTLTHFKTFFVTAGTTGSQTVTLETSTTVTVEVGTTTQILAGFNIGVLGRVEAFVNRTVKKTTASTDKETQAITWNFIAPGYYGLFKGTRKVTGEYGGLNCTRVDKGGGQYATEWVERPGGSYTTYSVMEEGAIRCEDTVPAGSLMRMAQVQLGCDGLAAKKQAAEQARRQAAEQAKQQVEKTASAGAVAPFAVPPGFVCEPGYYRLGTPDRLLNWYNIDGTDEIRLAGWSSATRAHWAVCHGPVSAGMDEYLFISHYSGKCLTLTEELDEGGRLQEGGCQTVDNRQRFYVYRDVPGSDLVGLQVKSSGFMFGQARVANGETLRQYSTGMADGTGTYLLEKIS